MSILLSTCTFPERITPLQNEFSVERQAQHRKIIADITAWRIKAKVGVSTGEKKGSITMYWEHLENHDEIRLYGPFGSGQVHINVHPGHAELRDSDGTLIKGKTVAEILYQRFKWRIPFEQLRYWILGVPAKAFPIQRSTFGENGHFSSITQGGWEIQYQAYQAVDTIELPYKLLLSTPPNFDSAGNTTIKIVLNRWSDIQFTE